MQIQAVQRCKAVIFDLDGTLCDTLESLAKSGNDMLERYGAPPFPVGRYKTFAGNGARKLVERVFAAASLAERVNLDQVFAEYLEHFREVCTYQVRPYPGLPELIADLNQAGMQTAVLTNKNQEMAEKVLAASYPEGSFRLISGQRPGRPLKPIPGAALSVLWELERRPEDCYYVGDSNVDMQTATNAGMTSIGVLWGFRPEAELRAGGADLIARNTEELREILLG